MRGLSFFEFKFLEGLEPLFLIFTLSLVVGKHSKSDPYFKPAIRISIVTSRGAQSEERLITTLKTFGMSLSFFEFKFLEGLEPLFLIFTLSLVVGKHTVKVKCSDAANPILTSNPLFAFLSSLHVELRVKND